MTYNETEGSLSSLDNDTRDPMRNDTLAWKARLSLLSIHCMNLLIRP